MDYEKAYNKALERAKSAIKDCGDNKGRISMIESIFPELQESEDERIRKTLLNSFEYQIKESHPDKEWVCGVKLKEIVSWLEKQKSVGEIVERCKNSWYKEGKIAGMTEGLTNDEKYQQGWHDALEKQGEKKSTDKVEPKFHEGDWIVNNEDGSIGQITDIIYDESGYGYNHTNGWLHSVFEKDFHLWTIQDAKDGDVLVDDLGNICIYQEPSTKLMYHSYCYGKHKYFIDMGGSHEIVGTCPATKEQRDLLFQKMKEAGYQWNPDTKELKKVEHKIAWSKKDEEFYNDIIKYFSDLDYSLSHEEEYVINWLKSLKERLI